MAHLLIERRPARDTRVKIRPFDREFFSAEHMADTNRPGIDCPTPRRNAPVAAMNLRRFAEDGGSRHRTARPRTAWSRSVAADMSLKSPRPPRRTSASGLPPTRLGSTSRRTRGVRVRQPGDDGGQDAQPQAMDAPVLLCLLAAGIQRADNRKGAHTRGGVILDAPPTDRNPAGVQGDSSRGG